MVSSVPKKPKVRVYATRDMSPVGMRIWPVWPINRPALISSDTGIEVDEARTKPGSILGDIYFVAQYLGGLYRVISPEGKEIGQCVHDTAKLASFCLAKNDHPRGDHTVCVLIVPFGFHSNGHNGHAKSFS